MTPLMVSRVPLEVQTSATAMETRMTSSQRCPACLSHRVTLGLPTKVASHRLRPQPQPHHPMLAALQALTTDSTALPPAMTLSMTHMAPVPWSTITWLTTTPTTHCQGRHQERLVLTTCVFIICHEHLFHTFVDLTCILL